MGAFLVADGEGRPVRLLEIGIQNYKSLRNVTLKPGPLSVFIGPNGAGKSNLCDALAFLGDMHRQDLVSAIERHGGRETIAYRNLDGSHAPLTFRVSMSLSKTDLQARRDRQSDQPVPHEVVVNHSVKIGLSTRTVDDTHRIIGESITCEIRRSCDSQLERVLEIARDDNGVTSACFSDFVRAHPPLANLSDDVLRGMAEASIASVRSPLLSQIVETFFLPLIPIASLLGTISTYALNPAALRGLSLADANPVLERDGGNLPATVKWLKRHKPRAFQSAINLLRVVMPTLEDVGVVRTRHQTLELQFRETGFTQPWTSADVSDGTLRALSLLTALYDPRSMVVVIDEPEDSLHPWAIGEIVDARQLPAYAKQLMLTTHSPIVIDHLRPEEIWVVSKKAAETRIDTLIELDPDAKTGLDAGQFVLSEFLDSGIVERAVPAL